ncbi:hypothetical protein Vretimale_15664 [Volvox reticuliferus]|uniref:Uncharacterized protein n=1 Tax=Volvox reticuliferus TaxID=1737510 RepID=A0A8J4GRR7_9CHLO|nr:hypothetical protein Vretimale_15664 [Volvox reticuliferus]
MAGTSTLLRSTQLPDQSPSLSTLGHTHKHTTSSSPPTPRHKCDIRGMAVTKPIPFAYPSNPHAPPCSCQHHAAVRVFLAALLLAPKPTGATTTSTSQIV